MNKYEELYNHAKYAFEEEATRFTRLEDKAGRFITIVSSLIAVYALTGRQLFASLFPAVSAFAQFKAMLAGLVLLSLVISWGFAFRAFQLQGTRKAPLNDEIFDFFRNNKLVTIQYAMAKRYCESRDYNKRINDWKAVNLKRCFKSTVLVVVFFVLFILVVAADANKSNVDTSSIRKNLTQHLLIIEEATMSNNGNQSNPENVNQPQNGDEDVPDFDVVAPEFEVSTESFDPTKVPEQDEDDNK